MTKPQTPPKILELVQRFQDNLDAYRSGQYNETQVRREFIDPFLKALGWDVDNEQGYAEQYKQVVHEDAIRVGGATKAPDYSCRIGGQRKFFIEAKKPSVNIKEDVHPAYQLRRYAWSAKLSLSILTDFEEFAVYDCRVKPDKGDSAAQARILYMRFSDYPERWAEIAAIFSPDAIRKGSFDRFVESKKSKRGTAEVDAAFLAEISDWREELARNIALRNKERGLKSRQLAHAVQSTIDRLIFLRIAEDRGIEPYGRLRDISAGKEIYSELADLFRLADARYNSGLFHFKEEKGRDSDSLDSFTLSLTIDDKVLRNIIRRLYYPDSPYQFDVIPADILGQVYEQFLGKVIRLTVKGQAKIEEKLEVKKAGGVYYTPTYIVDYIVRETVGKLLTGKTAGPKGTAASLRILDPACGSGSFLLGAYQFLLDWHLSQYSLEPDKWLKGRSPTLFELGAGGYGLTINERKRILLDHIFGVDIDPQAVEVTKLSLLLKVLEGESAQSLNAQLRLLPERALPDLGGNIKCGNSLIGPDFYENRQLSLGLTDEEELYRVNAFDWAAAFPHIVPWGGFDVVIGNPPYVRQEMLGEFKPYFAKHYKTYGGTADLYVYFVERGVKLLKENGRFAYIMANKWMRARYGKPLRVWLKKQGIEAIVDFGDLSVFQSATTYPCILTITNGQRPEHFKVAKIESLDFFDLTEVVESQKNHVSFETLNDEGWTLANDAVHNLMLKLGKTGMPLGKYINGNIYYGIKTGLNKAFVIDQETRNLLVAQHPKSSEIIKPFLAGRDIKRYQPLTNSAYMIFTRRGVNINEYPAVYAYLSKFKSQLMPKPKDWKGNNWEGRKPGTYEWYEIQDSVDYFEQFEKPKLLLPDISLRGNFSFDQSGEFYIANTAYSITSDDLYLLGILNSQLITFYYRNLSSSYRGGYLRFINQYLVQIPIQTLNPEIASEKEQRELMVNLVTQMLTLQKQIAAARMPHEKSVLQRQIAAADRQIDALVYQLYALTPTEIALVEAA